MSQQQQGQPDWAKFGLEPNERQPLNPSGPPAAGGRGTATAATAASSTATTTPAPAKNGGGGGDGGGGDLFGGQVQSANELFADDQVRRRSVNDLQREKWLFSEAERSAAFIQDQKLRKALCM